ncbi:unnamed protein product [Blepharisma stoltei]|uniref:Peptidase A1 domain-containing protein n=1 Tax=Blepharisma stoltei TaxID=1481888 RepID=A0AAU9K508_9CILI|nr:unnamed protein product [Blepharisma stoltei]
MLGYIFLLLSHVISQEIEHAIIYGSTEGLGYYYVDIWVGTPAVKQTVIVDTGSRLTAFPCAGCENCGQHMDSYFDYSKSKTASLVSCEEAVCSSCNDQKCGYSLSYAEGSSISGFLIEDFVTFGDDFEHSKAVPLKFGCHKRETNFFRTQKADGIMGLAFPKSKTPSIVDMLYRSRDISADIFAICFGKEDGYMTIGGYNASLHLTPIKWATLYDDALYSVSLRGVIVGGVAVNLNSKENSKPNSIVDSGTTYTVFTSSIYDQLWSTIEDICEGEEFCDGEEKHIAGEDNACYVYDHKKYQDIYDFFETFPIITLLIDNINVDWMPEYYLSAWPDHPNVYCIGIYSGAENILGSNFMRGHDIVFDRKTDQIGFAASDCNPIYVHGNSRTIHEKYPSSRVIQTSEFAYQFSILTGIFSSLFLLLGYFGYRKIVQWKNRINKEERSEEMPA